jgi:hypothetical protein
MTDHAGLARRLGVTPGWARTLARRYRRLQVSKPVEYAMFEVSLHGLGRRGPTDLDLVTLKVRQAIVDSFGPEFSSDVDVEVIESAGPDGKLEQTDPVGDCLNCSCG